MKIEALEDIKSDGYQLIAGDCVTVPDAIGTHWCKQGWAKDLAGAIPTGERRVLNAKLSIDTGSHVQQSEVING